MSSLRILHVIESLGRAGAEQALVNVLPRLRAAGHVVEVAALWPPYSLAEPLEQAGVVVHRIDMTHRWSIPQGVPRLAAILRRRRYHVVHAHSFFSALYTALTRPMLPQPVRVVTFHNLGYDSYPAHGAWHRVRKRIDAAMTRHGFELRLAVSSAVARHYERHLHLPPIEVQHNGISVDQLVLADPSNGEREAVRSGWGAPADAQVLLFCGRLVHEKGHRFFLAALEELRNRGLTPRAVIVGDGPLRDAVAAEIVHRGLTRQVTIHQAIEHAELCKWLRAADALVMASTHEGFPLAPAEAMALERPVVATSVGGLPELIEEGVSGVLVPPADPLRLADALQRVLTDASLRRELGVNGRKRVMDRFSSQAIAAELLDRYDRALELHARHAQSAADGGMRAIDA
jgi:glycosyltransferase involved in cell wall biosynthesis